MSCLYMRTYLIIGIILYYSMYGTGHKFTQRQTLQLQILMNLITHVQEEVHWVNVM